MNPRKPAKPEEPPVLECRRCGCRHIYVIWIRHRGSRIVRQRECRNCGKRFMTSERRQGEP